MLASADDDGDLQTPDRGDEAVIRGHLDDRDLVSRGDELLDHAKTDWPETADEDVARIGDATDLQGPPRRARSK